MNESLKSLGFALVTLLVALGCSSAPLGRAGGGGGNESGNAFFASDDMKGAPPIEHSTPSDPPPSAQRTRPTER